MTRSFGLDAASALKALKTASERFKNDDLNEDLARDCAIKAWQLCDHVFNAGSTRFATLGGLRHVKHTCPELAHDIALNLNMERFQGIRLARFHGGAFSRAFSFDISCLDPGGQTIFFNLDAVDFWSKFFDDNGITP